MLYTEENVKAAQRTQDGRRVFWMKEGDRLTPSARDWLRSEHIPVETRKKTYTTLFGGEFTEKPEELTHLSGNLLVPKTHPRIAFRGQIDALEAELLLCQHELREKPSLTAALQEMLDLVRSLIRADVLNEPVAQVHLCGLSDAELREHSHFPDKYYGQPHFLPAYTDGEAVLRLNRLRTKVRETELACCRAFADADGKLRRVDILQALNRLSSLCWILMIRCKAGKE